MMLISHDEAAEHPNIMKKPVSEHAKKMHGKLAALAAQQVRDDVPK